jgi:hypothetical protein
VNFVGQFTGRKLSLSTSGTCTNDQLNLLGNWVKNIIASGFFLVTLFLAVEEKVTGSKGFETKTIKDDGAQRAFD